MAASPTTTFEGFSISHAAILDGSTGGTYAFGDEADGDMYGVREGSLQADTDSYDNTGDDTVLSSWFWFNFATLTISAGYVPFKLIALLSGATLTSSGAAPNDYYNLPLWEEESLNQPTRPVRLRIPSKNASGDVRLLDIILFKVQFEPMNFDGPSYKDGLLINYGGKALMSSEDERGNALVGGNRAIGRLVSSPG